MTVREWKEANPGKVYAVRFCGDTIEYLTSQVLDSEVFFIAERYSKDSHYKVLDITPPYPSRASKRAVETLLFDKERLEEALQKALEEIERLKGGNKNDSKRMDG